MKRPAKDLAAELAELRRELRALRLAVAKLAAASPLTVDDHQEQRSAYPGRA